MTSFIVLMTKRFYKGPPRGYLEEAFVREISALERHPLDEVTVLAPTHLVGWRLLRKVVDVGGGAAGLKFVTFDGLAEGAASSAMAARSLKPLPSRAAMIMLEQAAKRELTSYSRLGALLPFRGLPAALWSTIRDLKEARITPDMLAEAAKEMLDPAKVEEIAGVWAGYEKDKESSGFCDDKDRQYLALEALQDDPPRLEAPLFIYGVYDATYLQAELLRSYVENNPAVAFIPWYEQKPAVEFTRPFIELLKDAGFVEAGSSSGAEDDPLSDFHDRLFNMEGQVEGLEGEGRIRLFTATDPYHEARETVRHLIERCRERDIPFDEAGIILRNGAEYGPLIMEVLEEADVPYRYAVSYPLTRTPGGRALTYLARLIIPRRRWSANVAEFLEASPLKKLSDGRTPPASSWMRVAREAGIVKWTEEYRNRLNLHIDKLKNELKWKTDTETVRDDIHHAEKLGGYMDGFLSELDRIPRNATWKTIAERLEKIYSFCFDESARGVSESLDLLRRMADMSDALPQSSAEEFIDALNREAAETNVTPEKNAAHGVVVADVMHARGACFRAVAIPGLSKGRFPGPIREDPLLLDYERKSLHEKLRDKTYAPELKKERRPDEEKFLFLAATGSGSDAVALSYPRGYHPDGKPAYPSSFFIEALEAFKGTSLKIEDELERLKAKPLSGVQVPEELERVITREEALRWLAIHRPDGLPQFPFLEAAERALDNHDRNLLTAHDAVIKDDEVKDEIRKAIENGTLRFSPGKIEKYAECPFSFFLQNVLKVGPPEEPEDVEEMTALDLGELYHRVLQAFYRRMRDGNLLPLDGKNVEQYHRILDDEADRIFRAVEEKGVMVGKGLMWNFHRERILEDARALLDKDIKDNEWTPAFFEVPVGWRGPDEDYEKELAGKEPVPVRFGDDIELRLTGRIDRIDVSGDGKSARIIDYKSGSDYGYIVDKLKKGEQIQVALYIKMAEKLLESSGKEVNEGYYYFINKTKNKGNIQIKNVKEALNNLDEAVSLIIDCIKSGLFHQYSTNTGKYGCEATCDYARACIYRAEYLKRKKHDDPVLELWNRLKEIE